MNLERKAWTGAIYQFPMIMYILGQETKLRAREELDMGRGSFTNPRNPHPQNNSTLHGKKPLGRRTP